jgi:hypothetical protein
MVRFSSDVDILKYEPILFGELHLSWQVLASGSGATLDGTTLTDAAADFASRRVEAGGVVHLKSADGALDGAYEIVSVDSATELTVSVVRADVADDPVAPPQGSDISYRISTFAPQATEAAGELTEHFGIRPGDPGSEIGVENILDTEVLRRVSTFSVIARVLAMWAGHGDSQGLWSKSVHYRQLFERARQRCRLTIDLGHDGAPDIVRIGGAIRLVRD